MNGALSGRTLIIRGVTMSAALTNLVGCASNPSMNPAFPVSVEDGRRHLAAMREQPKTLERPVVVAAGYLDPGFIAADVARRLRRATSKDAPISTVSFFWCFSFDAASDRLIDIVEREFPSDDPNLTTEVDVIGFSMGGLVARHAASARADGGGKRLNIARLFTIGTPHRGAALAPLAPFDRRAADMRARSAFLTSLDRDLDDERYEVVPYVRLRDAIVGEENAAPPNQEPWWVPNKPLSLSHNMAGADERIIADIARRLRNEPPLTCDPARPVPQ